VRRQTNHARVAYVKTNARVFGAATAAWLLGAAILLGIFWIFGWKWMIPVAIGAITVGYAWFLTALLNATDGTWLRRQGASAEELTSQALRRLRRDGWQTIDAVEFDGHDIDHVVVGPGGVWAIETKTSMVPMKMRADGIDLYGGDPCLQARQAARKIGLLLRSGGVELGVGAAVVLWGPGAPTLEGGVVELPSAAGPVLVFEGTRLRSNLKRFTRGELPLSDATAAVEMITSFVARRDRYQRSHHQSDKAPWKGVAAG